MLQINIDQKVTGLWNGEAVLACCFMRGCQITHSLGPEFEHDITKVMSEIKALGTEILNEPMLQNMRETFRSMPDMDPARYRPASEALIRRCLEKGLFRIKPLVDLNNLLSAKLRLPLGIYDLTDFESATWNYRLGSSGENYLTISQQKKSADGKLVLADDKGVIGSPVADSNRASIGDRFGYIGVIAFLPFGFSLASAATVLNEIQSSFNRFFRPTDSEIRIISK